MDIARGLPITENMITEEPGDLLGTGSDGRHRHPAAA